MLRFLQLSDLFPGNDFRDICLREGQKWKPKWNVRRVLERMARPELRMARAMA
jgi:hypothetical protein